MIDEKDKKKKKDDKDGPGKDKKDGFAPFQKVKTSKGKKPGKK